MVGNVKYCLSLSCCITLPLTILKNEKIRFSCEIDQKIFFDQSSAFSLYHPAVTQLLPCSTAKSRELRHTPAGNSAGLRIHQQLNRHTTRTNIRPSTASSSVIFPYPSKDIQTNEKTNKMSTYCIATATQPLRCYPLLYCSWYRTVYGGSSRTGSVYSLSLTPYDSATATAILRHCCCCVPSTASYCMTNTRLPPQI